MPKKIYDIVPPKVAHKLENTIKEMGAVPIRKTRKAPAKKTPKAKSAPVPTPASVERKQKAPVNTRRRLWIAGGIVVLILAIYLFNVLPKADIQISPQMDQMSLQEKVTASTSVQQVNLAAKVIPAESIEVEKQGNQDFPATGTSSNDSKATGTVTLYNKVSPAASFTMIKGTHLLSDSGKYFVTIDKVTIPAATTQGSKVTPGSATVKVQAEESGPDYNIKPSKFSAPKLSGTEYYYNIWAESTAAMYGGNVGNMKQATQDDIDGAKDSLSATLYAQATDDLKKKLSNGDVLLDGAISKEVESSDSSIKAGSQGDTFTETVKVKVTGLIFKKSDLDDFVKQDLASKIDQGKNILEKSIQTGYSSNTIDTDKGTAEIDLQLSAQSYYDIDSTGLVDLLNQKSASQIKEIINEKYGSTISAVTVNFWPFWVNKAPKNQKRITIGLHFD